VLNHEAIRLNRFELIFYNAVRVILVFVKLNSVVIPVWKNRRIFAFYLTPVTSRFLRRHLKHIIYDYDIITMALYIFTSGTFETIINPNGDYIVFNIINYVQRRGAARNIDI